MYKMYGWQNVLRVAFKISTWVFIGTYVFWTIMAFAPDPEFFGISVNGWSFREALSTARDITIYAIPVSFGLAFEPL